MPIYLILAWFAVYVKFAAHGVGIGAESRTGRKADVADGPAFVPGKPVDVDWTMVQTCCI